VATSNSTLTFLSEKPLDETRSISVCLTPLRVSLDNPEPARPNQFAYPEFFS
jgi:hypothetical protein